MVKNYDELREWAQTTYDRKHRADVPKIIVGTGTCGIAAGANGVVQAAETALQEAGIEAEIVHVGCIGSCFMEPLVDVIKPGMPRVSYGNVKPEQVSGLLRDIITADNYHPEAAFAVINQDGEKPVADIPSWRDVPFFAHQERRVLRRCGLIDPTAIEEYILTDGYGGLARALHEMTSEDVIETVKQSGLRGRGGAGFPTGLKWSFARAAAGAPKYVVCNFDEGDPGAFMNRSLVEGDPHAMLEGLIITAYAIGANQGYIYGRAEYPLALRRLRLAIQQATELGLLGDDVLGTGFNFRVTIKEGAGAFVCGEETALMASIEGKRGMPRPRPPFPAQQGLWGKPTNINNVGTLANVPNIIRNGAKWFASVGSERSKGTKVFCLTGKIKNAGAIEVPFGTKLETIIYDVGGGIRNDRAFKAAQTGGPSGGCIPVSMLDLEVDYENLAKVGSIIGSGGMVVVDEDNCMVDIARYFLSFTKEESCGKCTPCRVGTKRMLEILERIARGEGQVEDIALLEELSETVALGSLCGLGQTAPNPVLTTLRHFHDEYVAHIVDKHCAAGVCPSLVVAPCINACPADQNVPLYTALIGEGKFTEALEVIRDTNPFASVCGRVCDHNCEPKCRRGTVDEPIAIRSLKRFAADYERFSNHKWRPELIEELKEQRVAIVGGGPAGLTAAYYLGRRGYQITVYEALPVLGGMLMVGIPEYRLPKKILHNEIAGILHLVKEVKLNAAIGRDVTLVELRDRYDAVFLSTGAHASLKLGIEGERLPGVWSGVDFLRALNLQRLGHHAEMKLDFTDKRVAIIGGGNVAMDAARSALRLGSSEVRVLYRRTRDQMPALGEEVDGAEEEGIIFDYLVSPTRFVGNGRITGVECQRMELRGFDRSGRRRPVPLANSLSEFVVPCDIVIPAISQVSDLSYIGADAEVALGAKGRTIAVNAHTFATSLEGIFAGGDVTTGPDTVIEAIAAGRHAATYIERYLKGYGTERVPAQAPTKPEGEPPVLEEGEHPREREPALPAAERHGSFREVELGYTAEVARREAQRCLRCDLEED